MLERLYTDKICSLEKYSFYAIGNALGSSNKVITNLRAGFIRNL